MLQLAFLNPHAKRKMVWAGSCETTDKAVREMHKYFPHVNKLYLIRLPTDTVIMGIIDVN